MMSISFSLLMIIILLISSSCCQAFKCYDGNYTSFSSLSKKRTSKLKSLSQSSKRMISTQEDTSDKMFGHVSKRTLREGASSFVVIILLLYQISSVNDLKNMQLDMKQDLNVKIANLDNKFTDLDNKFTNLDEQFNIKLTNLDNKFNSKFTNLDNKFIGLDKMIIGLDNKFNLIIGGTAFSLALFACKFSQLTTSVKNVQDIINAKVPEKKDSEKEDKE